jgi:hypothetical protein
MTQEEIHPPEQRQWLELAADTERLNLTRIVTLAAEHERLFPTHGIDCACLDQLIRTAKRLTHVPGSSLAALDVNAAREGRSFTDELQRPGGPYRQQQRVDYVLRSAVGRRP